MKMFTKMNRKKLFKKIKFTWKPLRILPDEDTLILVLLASGNVVETFWMHDATYNEFLRFFNYKNGDHAVAWTYLSDIRN